MRGVKIDYEGGLQSCKFYEGSSVVVTSFGLLSLRPGAACDREERPFLTGHEHPSLTIMRETRRRRFVSSPGGPLDPPTSPGDTNGRNGDRHIDDDHHPPNTRFMANTDTTHPSSGGGDTRACCLCPAVGRPAPGHASSLPTPYVPTVVKRAGGVAPPDLGPLAGPFARNESQAAGRTLHLWAHETCLVWCPEVYFDRGKGRLRKVEAAIRRASRLKCALCDLRGAAVGCTVER